MADQKMVNFVRFGEGGSHLETITPKDTPTTIVDRVADPLGLNPKGEYALIHKDSSVQLVNDIYGQVEDMDSVIVAPAEVGGNR